LINKQKKGTISKGISTLVISRVLDIIVILMLFGLTLIIFKESVKISITLYMIVLIVTSLAITSSLLFFYYRKHIFRLFDTLIVLMRLDKTFIKSVIEKGAESMEDFGIIKSKRIMLISVLSTMGIVVSQYIFYYSIITSLGLKISFIQVVIGSIGILMISILPIQGIAGFGTYEGAWGISLYYFGINKEVAITTSFVMHIMQLVYLIFLAIVAFPYYKILMKNSLKDRENPKLPVGKNQKQINI